MAVKHTDEEISYMLSVFGYCQGNGRKCVRICSEMFPNRRLPNYQTFAAVERRLCEIGHFAPATAAYERMIIPDVEEEILERVAEDPKLSTRRLGFEVRVSKGIIHIQSVQDILPLDADLHLAFCQFINE